LTGKKDFYDLRISPPDFQCKNVSEFFDLYRSIYGNTLKATTCKYSQIWLSARPWSESFTCI